MKIKKYSGLEKKKAIYGYLFIAPFIFGFLAFMVKPLFQSLYMSLCEVTLSTDGFSMDFIGLKNYSTAFAVDPEFNRFLSSEITRMSYNSIATMVFSLFVALLLNREFKGRAFVRAVFFLPVILSSGVLVGLEFNNSLLSGMQDYIQKASGTSITSVLEDVFKASGFGTRAFQSLFDIVNSVQDIAMASGIQIIIFLSGLQNISSSMYEAADIEGCTKWETFWKITFPMISPLIIVNWIYTIIDFFMRSDNQVMEKISTTMISKMDYGFASSMAWIYFGIVIVIIIVSSTIISKGCYNYD